MPGGVVRRVQRLPREERELVLLARRGDSRSFEELVRPHEEVMFRVAFLITRNSAEAEDVVQETLIKAWRALPRFRPGAPLRPWLLRITANEARNRRRAEQRRSALALRAATPPTSEVSAEDAALAAEQRRALLERLERLPEQSRLVVACRYLLSLNEQETAAVLGVRSGTVKSRTARALDRLREADELRT